jgi:hypothetical protein
LCQPISLILAHSMDGHDSTVPDFTSNDRDVRLWLVTKLDGSWSSSRISTLNIDILQATIQIFSTLETALKLKFLFACLMCKKDTSLQEEIRNLFEIAQSDESEWVRVVASLLATQNGTLNLDYLLQNPTSRQVIEHLKETGSHSLSFLGANCCHRLSEGFSRIFCT